MASAAAGGASSINKRQLAGIFDSTNERIVRLAGLEGAGGMEDEYATKNQRNMIVEDEENNGKGSVKQTHSALMAHVIHKRTLSKELVSKRQVGVRTSHNQLPNIERKPRVGSSGQMSGKAASFVDTEELNSPIIDRDPFQRVNKFKNASISSQIQQSKQVTLKPTGMNKPRYSHQENLNPQHFQSAAPGHFPQVTDPDIISTSEIGPSIKKKATALDVSLLEIINQGKNQAKSTVQSTKNQNRPQQQSFDLQRSGVFNKPRNQNDSVILSDKDSNGSQMLKRSLVFQKPPKSTLPPGVNRNEGALSQDPVERKTQQLISINSGQNTNKTRKGSATYISNLAPVSQNRETFSQSVPPQVEVVSAEYIPSARGNGDQQMTNTDRLITKTSVISSQANAPNSLMQQIWCRLFESKSEDLGLRTNEKQLQRFLGGVIKHNQSHKLILTEMGFGFKSSPVLSQLIKVGSAFANWTHIDLSMNRLGTNLEPVIKGLKGNTRLVSLRLSNNEIGGAQNIQLLKSLVKSHPTLVDLDLSNDESNQLKNKLGNAGFEAIIEAIIDSKTSVIQMLNIAQNNITCSQPDTFNLLKVLLTVRSEQLISLNLSHNDLGPDFFATLDHQALKNLQELVLANTRLTNKSMTDLTEFFQHHKFSVVNLDLSQNCFTVEAYFKLLNSLKVSQNIKRLNLSRNNFGFDEHNEVQGHYYSVTELFVSQNKTLEELNLNDCRLGPEGAAILGRSLRRNQKICKLYLSQNRFEDRGLHHILEGILDNIQTSAQLSGDKIIVSPIQEVDLSKNGIELVNHTVLKTLCAILTCQESNMQMLSLRDNLIRDDPADAINVALKVNMSLLKFQIDMNPIKHATIKELELSVKRNVQRYKEKQGPLIKREIRSLYKERQKQLEDLPISLDEAEGFSMLETAVHIDEKVKYYEQRSAHYKAQFMQDDKKLDLIREEAHVMELQLLEEREDVREQFRDIDFEDDQLEARIVKQQRAYAKQLKAEEQKLEIVKLNQEKTREEMDKLGAQLERRREGHQLKVDAWERELQTVMREQAVSVMIQESYIKEICRVKKQKEDALAEETKDESINQPPNTASSSNRFASRKIQKRGSSTLRKLETTIVSNHEFVRPSKTIRAAGQYRGQQPLQVSQGQNPNVVLQPQQTSPEQKISDLQRLKKELKMQRRQQEAETTAIQNKENNLIKKPVLAKTGQPNADIISHTIVKEQVPVQNFSFRVPAQQNFP